MPALASRLFISRQLWDHQKKLMLPAVIADDDQTLAVAGQRGSKVFGYAFPRLLISFGFLTVLFVAILMLLASLLGIDPEDSSPASFILPVIGAMSGASIWGVSFGRERQVQDGVLSGPVTGPRV